jgi:hypothetical protein
MSAHSKYRNDLLKRVRRASCDYCGAKSGKKCIGANGLTKGCHCARHNTAKYLGFVQGRGVFIKRGLSSKKKR